MEAKSIGLRRCLDIVRGITSTSKDERHTWAAVPGWWYVNGEIDDHEAATISAVLSWATLVETEIPDVREGFLDSMGTMAENDRVPLPVLEEVTSGLQPEDLDVAEECHYETLLSKRDEYRRIGGNPVFDRLPGAQP